MYGEPNEDLAVMEPRFFEKYFNTTDVSPRRQAPRGMREAHEDLKLGSVVRRGCT